MKPKDIGIAAVALVFVAAIAYVWLAPTGVANRAPQATFSTLKGDKIELDALRGKPVLINFWATSCVGCVREMPDLAEIYQDLNPQGFELVGVAVSYDPPNQVLEFVKRFDIPFPISLDIDDRVATAFGGVSLIPSSFLIDAEGRVVFKKLGELDIPKLRRDIEDLLKKTPA